MQVSLDYTASEWQRQCHINKKRFSVYALHRRSGKTELAIMELIDKAMKTNKDLAYLPMLLPFYVRQKLLVGLD